jgi:hypothetical protein
MRENVAVQLRFPAPDDLMTLAEDFGAVLADLGEYKQAARLLGSADAMRERHSRPRPPAQEVEIEEPFTKARARLSEGTWEREYQHGRNTSVEDGLMEAQGLSRPVGTSQEGNSYSRDTSKPR